LEQFICSEQFAQVANHANAQLDFAHFQVLGRRLADRPEDVFSSDELESPLDREFGRAERSGRNPSFLPERLIEHVEAAFGVGRPQPGAVPDRAVSSNRGCRQSNARGGRIALATAGIVRIPSL
jgi:hypothetical protein